MKKYWNNSGFLMLPKSKISGLNQARAFVSSVFTVIGFVICYKLNPVDIYAAAIFSFWIGFAMAWAREISIVKKDKNFTVFSLACMIIPGFIISMMAVFFLLILKN